MLDQTILRVELSGIQPKDVETDPYLRDPRNQLHQPVLNRKHPPSHAVRPNLRIQQTILHLPAPRDHSRALCNLQTVPSRPAEQTVQSKD